MGLLLMRFRAWLAPARSRRERRALLARFPKCEMRVDTPDPGERARELHDAAGDEVPGAAVAGMFVCLSGPKRWRCGPPYCDAVRLRAGLRVGCSWRRIVLPLAGARWPIREGRCP